MNPRLSLLTFPQRYDGTRLHVRMLVVPRLDMGWSGDPLQPLIVDMPAVGDTTDPFADADFQFEARVLKGLDRFPSSVAPDLVAPLPTAERCDCDMRARCSSRWWRRSRPVPAVRQCSAIGRVARGTLRDQQVPAAKLSRVVRVHRAARDGCGDRRQLSLRDQGNTKPNPPSWRRRTR